MRGEEGGKKGNVGGHGGKTVGKTGKVGFRVPPKERGKGRSRLLREGDLAHLEWRAANMVLEQFSADLRRQYLIGNHGAGRQHMALEHMALILMASQRTIKRIWTWMGTKLLNSSAKKRSLYT